MIVVVKDAKSSKMKEMIGGCCVCSDDRGWTENPLVYCDGQGCNVAVHQACYGIVSVPTGNWYCRKCESPESKVKCELCPSVDGALKPTDTGSWAHVVCALYIPEVRFGNVTTMEPIIVHQVPQERFNKVCYICQENGLNRTDSSIGACMQCNRSGCRQVFHVTCAQAQGLLCEEAGHYQDNVKYCGYCHHHYNRVVLKKGMNVKVIPPYRPKPSQAGNAGSESMRHSEIKEGGDSPRVGMDVIAEKEHSEKSNKRKLSRSGTPTQPSPGASPRPTTPGTQLGLSSGSASVVGIVKASASPTTNGKGDDLAAHLIPSASGTLGIPSKVSSIVVHVPLEAAHLNVSGPSGLEVSSERVTSPQSSPCPEQGTSGSTQPPVKRSRSESSDKSERRRSRRSGEGTSTRHRKSPTRIKSSPEPRPSSTGSGSDTSKGSKIIIKEEKEAKVELNGASTAPHLLGNVLNPSSSMTDTLNQEVQAHSVYTRSSTSQFQGPHFPRPTPVRGPGSTNNLSSGGSGGTNASTSATSWGANNNIHTQSLEQLLERQWEQGSQFLMEQAHHFDIASLLSCLHQLRQENAQLEEHVNNLVARRDHLLAVNARLAIPLVSNNNSGAGTGAAGGGSGVLAGPSTSSQSQAPGSRPVVSGPTSSSSMSVASAVLTNSVSNIVENGLATPQEQYRAANIHRGGLDTGGSGGRIPYPSGGPNNQSSVVVRANVHGNLHHHSNPHGAGNPHSQVNPHGVLPTSGQSQQQDRARSSSFSSGYSVTPSQVGQPSPNNMSSQAALQQVVMQGTSSSGSRVVSGSSRMDDSTKTS